MKREARTIASGSVLRCDVCIVGAGPAGLALAEALAEHGHTVCILESGGEQPDRHSASLARGETGGYPYDRLERVRARALGGSSWLWGGRTADSHEFPLRCRPLDDIDFAPRSFVAGSGWPLRPEQLAPWYRRAEAWLELAPAEPDSVDDDHPGLPLDGAVETMFCQFAARGVIPGAVRRLSANPDVDLVSGATVVELAEPGTGVVEAVRVATPTGAWFTVHARHYVLAAGGLENARLLLASSFGRPGGRANPCDRVGRYFMEHLHIDSGILRPVVEDFARATALYYPHRAGGAQISAMLRVPSEAQLRDGLLNTVAEFRPLAPPFDSAAGRALEELRWAFEHRSCPREMAGHLAAVACRPDHVARAIASRLPRREQRAPVALGLVFTSEQSPDARNRVTLGDKADHFGMPRARLDWRIATADLSSLARTQAVLARAFETAGLGGVDRRWADASPKPRVYGCSHAIGTTRMSKDATTGVVDPDARVHGMANLSIAGSSVMPTGGAVTVTATLVALALRLAGHLHDELR